MCGMITPLEQPQEVLTSEQAAAFLQLNRVYLVAQARKGAIPGHRIGSHWRFLRSELLAWLASQGHSDP